MDFVVVAYQGKTLKDFRSLENADKEYLASLTKQGLQIRIVPNPFASSHLVRRANGKFDAFVRGEFMGTRSRQRDAARIVRTATNSTLPIAVVEGN